MEGLSVVLVLVFAIIVIATRALDCSAIIATSARALL